MVRTKTKAAITGLAGQVKWVNNGGPFYMKDGVRIPNGEIFFAHPNDVPKAFRDTIVPVDPNALSNASPIEDAVNPTYSIKQRGASSNYDIFDGQGKRLNDKNLTQEEAQELLDRMNVPTTE